MNELEIERAKVWLTERIVSSDLVKHYFELRDKGMPGDPGADAVRTMAIEFMLGRCGFFASAVARRIGREHMVSVVSKSDGHLLHAAVACSPQYGPPYAGWCVDVLGRIKLPDLIAGLRVFGDVEVELGNLIAEEDYADGEQEALVELAGVLPWTRSFVGRPLSHERDPAAFVVCVAAACQGTSSFSP